MTVVEPGGKLEIIQASTSESKFSKLKANWLETKPPLFVIEKSFGPELIEKYQNVQNKKNTFVIFGDGLGISSLEEICEGKFGIFKINQDKIERTMHTLEDIDLI